MTKTVTSRTANGVCTLTLNRPEKLNAVNIELAATLTTALAAANADDTVRAVILQGAGRAFCAGNDLDASNGAAEGRLDRAIVESHARDLQSITRQIVGSDKIYIAAVHGWAVGAGFEWVLNCDLSIWGESAQAFFPEIRLGMFPTGGVTALLPRSVGLSKAREMLLLGEKFSAADLQGLGLATRVVPDSAVIESAAIEARRVSELPVQIVALLKQALNRTFSMSFEAVLDLEVQSLLASFMSSRPRGAGHIP